MAISIKDPETDELARRLADQTGETITQALKRALRERLVRVKGLRDRTGTASRLLAIGSRCAAHVRRPAASQDHGDFFYDERGLPK